MRGWIVGVGLMWGTGCSAQDVRVGTPLPGGAVVAYSPATRVSFFGIEKLHPFDIAKMDRIAADLIAADLLIAEDFAAAAPVDDAILGAVHDAAYIASLHRTPVLARALEVPVPNIFPRSVVEGRVRNPFRVAVGGTILAARGAVAHGLGVNLGGGFHHAMPDHGHGFCVYNDVAVAVATLRGEGFDAPVLIVDTDAHQGDGNHAFFADDPSVFTYSMHQAEIFPPRIAGDRDVELGRGTDDVLFLGILDREVRRWMAQVSPGLVIHVAGADVLSDDPLTDLAMTPEGLVDRDLAVLRLARADGVPLLHLLAGGYGPSAADAQSRSVAAMLREVRGDRR